MNVFVCTLGPRYLVLQQLPGHHIDPVHRVPYLGHGVVEARGEEGRSTAPSTTSTTPCCTLSYALLSTLPGPLHLHILNKGSTGMILYRISTAYGMIYGNT